MFASAFKSLSSGAGNRREIVSVEGFRLGSDTTDAFDLAICPSFRPAHRPSRDHPHAMATSREHDCEMSTTVVPP